MKEYQLTDYIAAKKSLVSTLNKIEKAIVSLEEKEAQGKKLTAQITLSNERVKALKLSILLIDREIDRMNEVND
ncbi:hypothetical protein DOK76_08310 [Vagococcus sp. DIV0080]|uniref:Uncharacterized protein n=1 Tax=Candidatus Vagococcus giribetii TaxID=2230876 RepID=A0ABS3HTT0_9ENTE|nr:hypothetical protein [Vagococcus sp. DIV0080]